MLNEGLLGKIPVLLNIKRKDRQDAESTQYSFYFTRTSDFLPETKVFLFKIDHFFSDFMNGQIGYSI